MGLPDSSDVKERLSLAYVRAVAARCQCFVTATEGADLASVDAMLTSALQPRRMLSLQLKARTGVEFSTNGDPTIDLEMKNYDDLRRTDVTAPQLLILVEIPKDAATWLSVDEEQLVMRRCAWWTDLFGEAEAPNSTTRRVKIPRHRRFDPTALSSILNAMARIAAGGPRRPLYEY